MSLVGLSDRSKPFRVAIRGAIAKGWGANKIESFLRSTYGKAYQRRVLQSDVRIMKGAKTVFEPMKNIRKDYRISERHYQPSSITNDRKYATVVDYTYTPRGEDEVFHSHYTIRHDTLMRVEEIEDLVRSGIERKYEVENITIGAPREAYKFKKS